MKNTTFVSAGAGSGKTYKLTEDIARIIKEGRGKFSAEQVILTTYTKAAAAELREKVRSKLYSEGLYRDAMNVDNAAIGTIHSIAFQFVSRYWYLLGVSANVAIMAEEDSKFYVSQSLASLPSDVQLALFDRVLKSLCIVGKYHTSPDFWKDELKSLIGNTIEMCVSDSQLEQNREQSKELLARVFKWPDFDISDKVISDALASLKHIFESLIENARKDKEVKRAELYEDIRELEERDKSGDYLPIYRLQQVISNYTKKPSRLVMEKCGDDVEYLRDLLEKIPRSKQVKELVEEYIDAIFDLAIKWKREYEAFKRERCLLDNGDLLIKFNELLNNESVVEEIKSRYKLAFVDEFQDCSPLLVNSFKRLSHIMEYSEWVGDIKQAIYGFRGSNTELINTVISDVSKKENGNSLVPLSHCWRSNSTIVNLVNEVFINVFEGQIKREYVELFMPERKEDQKAPEERQVRHWMFKGGYVNERIIDQIEELVSEKNYDYEDIAILCRFNDDITNLVKILKKRGIPYNVAPDRKNAVEDEVSSFLKAVISVVAQSGNELSKAIIVNSAEQGYGVSRILSDRLKFVEADKDGSVWLEESQIISRIMKLRETVCSQDVKSAVESVVAELNLQGIIKRIDPSTPAYNYCAELINEAAVYEQRCSSLGLSSTLIGFSDYLVDNILLYPGKSDGITITTYHKSKGLQWPCVILYSLETPPVKDNLAFFGVLAIRKPTQTDLRLIPGAINKVCGKLIVDASYGVDDDLYNVREALRDEGKRLLYVGMTRPQEQLILIQNGDSQQWLSDVGCDIVGENDSEWYGTPLRRLRSIVVEEKKGKGKETESVEEDVVIDEPIGDVARETFEVLRQPSEPIAYSCKFLSPSKVKEAVKRYSVVQCEKFAPRLQIRAMDGKDSTIGNFIHHAMCLWSGDKALLESLAAEYGVKVDIANLCASIEAFRGWMADNYKGSMAEERELPFSFTNASGQCVNGEIDLVYHTEEGAVLVDYKTYQGEISQLMKVGGDFSAEKYVGQIALYDEALQRAGNKVIERLICYLSLGVVVRFEQEA